MLIVVALLAVVISPASYWGSGRSTRGSGASDLVMDREPEGPLRTRRRMAQEEIRQMLEAKSARRVARGQPALDIDAELAALGGPRPRRSGAARGGPPARRGAQRAPDAAGQEPLDVDAEVERQLRGPQGVVTRPRRGLGTHTTMADQRRFELDDLLLRPGLLPQSADRGHGGGRRLPLDRRRDLQPRGVRGRRLGADRRRGARSTSPPRRAARELPGHLPRRRRTLLGRSQRRGSRGGSRTSRTRRTSSARASARRAPSCRRAASAGLGLRRRCGLFIT